MLRYEVIVKYVVVHYQHQDIEPTAQKNVEIMQLIKDIAKHIQIGKEIVEIDKQYILRKIRFNACYVVNGIVRLVHI